MTNSNDAREDYLALRESATSVQLATLASNNNPEASYAPCAWFEGVCYLYLSGLSSHSANLERNSKISLLLIEEAANAPNAFARKRASLHGTAQIVKNDDVAFANVMQV
ncbi:MAG: pyridoxamine 5'-phosphate oxidase family protein, partial [Gammaproteobacteria bacterium]|nr:pyridoxamine 5'-phosphate oxidase family protein [Gammaproteobacteria bacterium]